MIRSDVCAGSPGLSIKFLSDEESARIDIKPYLKLLNIDEEKINLRSFNFLRFWYGSGTINCHTLCISRKSYDILNAFNKTREILSLFDNPISNKNINDWHTNFDTETMEMQNLEYVNFHILISLAICWYDTIEEAIFNITRAYVFVTETLTGLAEEEAFMRGEDIIHEDEN